MGLCHESGNLLFSNLEDFRQSQWLLCGELVVEKEEDPFGGYSNGPEKRWAFD